MNDTPRPGWWTCRICQPNIKERGGWDAYYEHYNRVHGTDWLGNPTPTAVVEAKR